MATTIKLKNSVTATNAPTSLVQGEVAINITDKKVWVGNAATTPVLLLGSGADGTFTNLTVSGVASFADGTVSLPSITNIGDTNTGIFFPAADTIAFTEGGVESMRIDSSGNVGIGTSSPNRALTIYRTSSPVLQLIDATTGTTTNDGLLIQQVGVDTYIENAEIGFMQFRTSATERMRIDSSGNVGIGTSAPAVKFTINPPVSQAESITGLAMQLNSSNATSLSAGILNINSNDSQAADLGGSLTFGGNYISNTNGVSWAGIAGRKENSTSSNTAGYLQFTTRNDGGNTTERMRIDSSGNVGIGTSSPSFPLDVVSNSSSNAIQVRGRSSDNVSRVELRSNDAATLYGAVFAYNNFFGFDAPQASGTIAFNTNGSERMRIDSSGNLLVNLTSQQSSGKFCINFDGATHNGQVLNDTGSASSIAYTYFLRSGTLKGYIGYTTGSNLVSYNTTSDYRLKENIIPLPNALDKVMQLKPSQYTWKENGYTTTGFIAHELQEVVPDCVSGEKDAVDEEGKIKPQGIDTSFLVATLTAAIQEQQTLIENLTTRLNALEGK